MRAARHVGGRDGLARGGAEDHAAHEAAGRLEIETLPGGRQLRFGYDAAGNVLGEGAAMLVFEELEHARRRGAHIYGEIIGYGATSEGYDMVAPSGEGAERCMKMALATTGGITSHVSPASLLRYNPLPFVPA